MTEASLMLSWRTAILLVVMSQLLIIAGVLVFRGPDLRANRLLAALLVSICVVTTPTMIGFAGFYNAYPWLSFAPFNAELLIGPLIYTYFTQLITGRHPRHFALTLAPGIAYLAYQAYWFVQPLQDKWSWVAAGHNPYIAPAATALAILFAGAGLALSAHRVLGYRAWLAAQSSAKAAYDLRGALFMLAALALPFAALVAMDLIEAVRGPLSYVQEYPVHVLLALAGCALGVAALAQPAGELPHPDAAPTPSARRPDPDPIPEAEPDWASIAASLRNQLKTQAWYAEPRLSLAQLCDRSGLSEYYVSRAINVGAGMNFNRFVNSLRVEAIKSRLEAGAPDLLRAALECGFNSKASFNRVFREIVGETPSAYRRRISSSSRPKSSTSGAAR
ncbi:helix-turn-helix domain-containing protein [Maricaulaceae bacterium MS644]